MPLPYLLNAGGGARYRAAVRAAADMNTRAMENTLNPAQIGGFKIPRKPLPQQIQNQPTPAGIQQQGTGSGPHVVPGNSQGSIPAPANLRSQAGTQGGPTEGMQGTKPVYLYKKELEGAQKANVAERKEAKATADGLLKEMQSLSRDITQVESKIVSEQRKKVPSGERLAALNSRLQARRDELRETTGGYRDASKRLNPLEDQDVAIKTELDKIRKMRKGKTPDARPTPEAQAYQAQRKRFKGMDPNHRELFTAGRQNPEIGENLYRDHLADPGPAPHVPMPGRTAPSVPFVATDATFGSIADAKGFLRPEHLPAGSAPATPRHSAESAGADTVPVYQYKQNLRELKPEVRKKIMAEQKQQDTLRGEVTSLTKAIGQKEQEIHRATASTMRAGSSRAGASLPQLHSDLHGLQGQLAAREREFSDSITRLDQLNNLGGAVNTDLKNIRKETALRFQSPVVPGEGLRSPLHFQSPIAPNPGRAQYRADGAQFKAMSPAEKAEYLNSISGRQDPSVGRNPDRDILESRVTGQPIADRRTEKQKAESKAEDEKWWKDLRPDQRAMFGSSRIEEGHVIEPIRDPRISRGPKTFGEILSPDLSGSSLNQPLTDIPPPPPFRSSQAPRSGSGTTSPAPPFMSGAIPPAPPSSMRGGHTLGSIKE